ncbi:glycosyltransferase family 2 protein [Patellaria atrata CBS 101060]|uniref:chitin synthase n=1 Tax=Patellaria atrata CBS 101060 TaxID=1346257 RepID=A0A9P4VN50_9PEZI|nr:glycosyltransferase family 2 protein [Patellaria atrata CBS 101060]
MSTSVFPRSQYDNGVPDITDPWPVKDIIYVGVMSPVMLLATLEWVLWILSLNYCFFRVFQKAESTGVKVLACLMSLLFTIIRLIFLPVMLVTLPLPAQVTKYFPPALVSALQWFAFWTFSTLLVIPWLICIYQLVTQSLGKTKRIMYVLDELTAPKVVIVMPCYNEPPDILVRTVDSLVDCDYPPSCLHIFLSFDGDEQNEMYLKTIEKLGVPLTLEDYPKSIDLVYRSTRITASRFPHGGKRMCQKRTFQLIDRVYTAYLKRNDNLFILFIDSDCILDKVCIQNFMYDMELKPGSKQNMLAMTGVITSTTEKNSLITILQDMEYIHGQLFERSVESGCGAVTCLPGALTILRFSAFRKMAKYYFADKFEQCEDMFDYAKCHLGEDRWLTHLFMIGAKERYQIQMNTGAFCKTEAVQDFKNLLKQRRRWFLGFITNEACMLTDTRLWRRYPLLLIIRFAQNTIRTTALLFFIMVISLATTSQKVVQLPIGFIAISLGLNWAIMIYFGAKLGRFKIWMYPLMFILNPFFNWLYMVYGIFTASQRTWGGPRADAGTADTQTTAQAAVERAEMMGDDLNVVPETFKPALAARRSLRGRTDITIPATHLQPSDKLHGRFAAATQTLEGHYVHDQGSTTTLPEVFVRNPNAPRMPLHPRNSFESELSATSGLYSFYMPRRVESIMDPEDTRYYHEQQRNQRPAGGAYFEENNYAAAYDNANQSTVRQPDPSTDSDDASTGTEMYLLKKPYAPVPHGHLSSSYQGEHRTAANASNSSISLFHPGSNITASGASGPSQGPMPRPVSGLAVPSPLAQMTRNSTPTELDEMLPRGSGSSEVRTVQGEAVGKESEGKRHRKKLSKPRPESK